MSPGWGGRKVLPPHRQEEQHLAPLPCSEGTGARARADAAAGSVFLTALEQILLQSFAGRWLKATRCVEAQSWDGDLAPAVPLGANA